MKRLRIHENRLVDIILTAANILVERSLNGGESCFRLLMEINKLSVHGIVVRQTTYAFVDLQTTELLRKQKE